VLVVDERSTGLRRAEIEGQVGRFLADPALLGALSRAHDRLQPREAPYAEVRIVERSYALRDSEPTVRRPSGRRAVGAAVTRWLFAPQPRARVAVLRLLLYVFIPVDVLLTTTFVVGHAAVPPELYAPLRIGRLLPLRRPVRGSRCCRRWSS
jgi:hypothetical protein